MESVIMNYIEEKLTDNLKKDFVVAAIHFIVDEELCSEEDIKKIENRKKDKRDEVVDDCLKLLAIYGYVVYRTVASGTLDEETEMKNCKLLMELSRTVSNYITTEIEGEELVSYFKEFTLKLRISNECNKFVLSKIRDIKEYDIQWEATHEI